MVYTQTRICPGEWDTHNSRGFWDTNRSHNPYQKTRSSNNLREKESQLNSGLYSPSRLQNENQRKLKENKYLDVARELKRLWKVMVIPIIIGALGTIPKGLVRRLQEFDTRGQAETIQTTALLKLARIPRRVLETWRDLLLLTLQWKSISWSWCEKLSRSNMIIIIKILI